MSYFSTSQLDAWHPRCVGRVFMSVRSGKLRLTCDVCKQTDVMSVADANERFKGELRVLNDPHDHTV